MTSAPAKLRIHADEFLQMDLGDGLHELVRGEIVRMPPPQYWHGLICGFAYALLLNFGRRTGHGHAGTNDSTVRIDDQNVRGADVCYYSEARWPRARVSQENPPVPPDLVAEVLSTSDRPGEVLAKVADYLRVGVAVVWVIDPGKRRLTIHRGDTQTPTVLEESEIVENLPELPGFRCQVADFFG